MRLFSFGGLRRDAFRGQCEGRAAVNVTDGLRVVHAMVALTGSS
jgi:hypothetical protein